MTIRRDLHEVAFTAAHVSTGSYHSDVTEYVVYMRNV